MKGYVSGGKPKEKANPEIEFMWIRSGWEQELKIVRERLQ